MFLLRMSSHRSDLSLFSFFFFPLLLDLPILFPSYMRMPSRSDGAPFTSPGRGYRVCTLRWYSIHLRSIVCFTNVEVCPSLFVSSPSPTLSDKTNLTDFVLRLNVPNTRLLIDLRYDQICGRQSTFTIFPLLIVRLLSAVSLSLKSHCDASAPTHTTRVPSSSTRARLLAAIDWSFAGHTRSSNSTTPASLLAPTSGSKLPQPHNLLQLFRLSCRRFSYPRYPSIATTMLQTQITPTLLALPRCTRDPRFA